MKISVLHSFFVSSRQMRASSYLVKASMQKCTEKTFAIQTHYFSRPKEWQEQYVVREKILVCRPQYFTDSTERKTVLSDYIEIAFSAVSPVRIIDGFQASV